MIHKIMRQVYVMNVYSVFFLELYNKHKESYGWTWSLYISCIPQLKKKKKSVKEEKYNYLRVFFLFLKKEIFFIFFIFFYFFKKANIKGRVEAAN